jgi:hypothetical protein
MLPISHLLPAVTVVLGLLADSDPVTSGPQAGQDMPGPMQVLNVTGHFEGKYHCPITDNALNPGIILFCRPVPKPGQPLAKLLQGLDGIVQQFPDVRYGLGAVFLDDAGYRNALIAKIDEKAYVTDLPLTKAIIAKDERFAELKALAKQLGLKHMELSLDTPEGPSEYHIHPQAEVTALLYYKFKVLGNWTFAKDELTDEAVDRLLGELKAKLGKIEKPMQGRR